MQTFYSAVQFFDNVSFSVGYIKVLKEGEESFSFGGMLLHLLCLSNIEKANVATESGLYTMALQIIEFWGRLSLYANRQIWKLGMKVCK